VHPEGRFVREDHCTRLVEGTYQKELPREVTRPTDSPETALFTMELYFERQVAVPGEQTPPGTIGWTTALVLAGNATETGRLYTVPLGNLRIIATTLEVVGPESLTVRPDEGVL
jgi:hypothetical protein